MGFNCIQPLPIHEFAGDRSWGYNPASFFSPESSYGSPFNLARLVDAAHRTGLAVIFDVVYNHAGPGDNVLWAYDGYDVDGGIYFEGGQMTSWGRGPAWQKPEVQDFFYQNARMFLEDYHADGLRFDATTQINGSYLKLMIDRLRRDLRRSRSAGPF
jgi:1,4-alpha-glucan branching enzyme